MSNKIQEPAQLDLPAVQNAVWHSIDVANILQLLSTSISGLSSYEANERLAVFGKNLMSQEEKPSFLRRIWEQINNVLVGILLIAAVVALGLQAWPDAGLILGVVVINVIIGLFQEGKAEKAADAIKAMLSPFADVVRDGERITIEAELLVPGDLVLLKPGDNVPADIRLLEVNNLQVQEAMLTGESVPISKNLHAVDAHAALGDRKCIGYSATAVVAGTARGIVIATGDKAEIGKINTMVNKVDKVKMNLEIQLEYLSYVLAAIVFVIAATTMVVAIFRTKQGVLPAFQIAMSIAVAMIPVGLPALVTFTLAIGTTVMASENAIVRVLPSVETLGSITVICSDKTGTLTTNQMTAVAFRTVTSNIHVTGVGYNPHGSFQDAAGNDLIEDELQGFRPLLEGFLLCNDSSLRKVPAANGKDEFVPTGNPTEVALIVAGMKAGFQVSKLSDEKPRIAEIPFESTHKFMATAHQDGPQRVLFVKGAPDRLFPMCSSQVEGNSLRHLGQFNPDFWHAQQAELSRKGLRVLALCRGELPADQDLSQMSAVSLQSGAPFLTFVALVGIVDPPRPEAIHAVDVAQHAGVAVKMITGDHALTAAAIGEQLGLQSEGIVYTGPEVDAMSEEELQAAVMRCNVFARASPENKLRIVRALQACKQVAAMTGDGVNDAPALKAADVGIAMGITGTDVAKESAKLVLADDNFGSIVVAIREGRRVWDNLRKCLLFNQPANFAQGGCILFALLLNMEAPLTNIQVLYVNMITAVAMGVMLAAEPVEPGVMDRRPRRPGKRLLGKLIMWRWLYASTVLIVLVLTSYWLSRREGRSTSLQRIEAFNALVFAEVGYCLTTRFMHMTALHKRSFFGNVMAYYSIAITVSLQLLLTYTPGLNAWFVECESHKDEPCLEGGGMQAIQWARVVGCMVLSFLAMEFDKLVVEPLCWPYLRPVFGWIDRHVSKLLYPKAATFDEGPTPAEQELRAVRVA